MNTRFLSALVAALAAFTVSTKAADSTWLLGDNGKVAVNSLEHRLGASGRGTDVTLIIGSHLLKGSLVNRDSGKITLKETGRDGYTFEGTIAIDYQNSQTTLKGRIKFGGSASDSISAKIKSKELNFR